MTETLGWAEAIALLVAALVANAPARAQSALPQGSFLEVDGAKLYYEEYRISASTFTPSGTIGEGTDDLR